MHPIVYVLAGVVLVVVGMAIEHGFAVLSCRQCSWNPRSRDYVQGPPRLCDHREDSVSCTRLAIPGAHYCRDHLLLHA